MSEPFKRLLAIAALFAAVAGASCATGGASSTSVSLSPGDSVVVQSSDDGFSVVERSQGAASLSDFERALADQSRDNPAAIGENAIVASGNALDASQPIDPSRLKLRLLVIAPHDTVLVIDNGYDRALSYRAIIWVNDQERPTDVCWVLPGHHGYEHWPYLVDRIELLDLRLETWTEGDRVPCR
jgi:hypothetical protein